MRIRLNNLYVSFRVVFLQNYSEVDLPRLIPGSDA